jgi:DNA-binding PadR family transcriptional regulator
MGKENKSKFALLGMLSLSPMSGYDLRKVVESSVGHFWNESYPQIYPMLKQLTEEGLTTCSVSKQQGKPDRYIYALTNLGWEALERWLGEPFEYQVQRNELLLKLFFGGYAPTAVSIEHVQRQRTMQVQLLHTYEQTEEQVRTEWESHSQLPYWLFTLSFGKHISRAIVAWCDETLTTLEHMKQDAPLTVTKHTEERV